MNNQRLKYRLNRFLSYYFLDFSFSERCSLWWKVLLHEIINIQRFRSVSFEKYSIGSIYVISLEYRHDRRNYITKIFGDRKIEFNFYNAVSPDTIGSFSEYFTSTSFKNLTLGSKCCAASHINLWKKISLQVNNYLFIIFEDDVVLNKNFDIYNCATKLPTGFDIFYLGNWNNRGRDVNYWVSEEIFNSFNPRKGMYAYAITPSGAKKMLSRCLPIDIIYGGIDTKIGKDVRQGKVNAIQIIPNPVSVNFGFPSDIFNPSLPDKELYPNVRSK